MFHSADVDADWRWGLGFVAVLVGSALLIFTGLGRRAIVSEEFRWVEVAREMQLSGNYFHPTINAQTYYDKPLLSYWLIVAASKITGRVDELAARLPAVISGCVCVWLVMFLTARIYDQRTAVFAGSVLATSFGFVFYARRATADMETTAGVLLAIWMYVRCSEFRSRWWVILLWLTMAITSLTKGLLGFVLPMAVFTTHSIWSSWDDVPPKRRSWTRLLKATVQSNGWLFNRWTMIAVPVAMVVYFAPFVASAWVADVHDGLPLVLRENMQRFWSPLNHKGPPYLYCGVIFVLIAPWSTLLPASLMPRQIKVPGDRLVGSYFAAVFAFFSLAASRRSYYLVPVTPPAALLVARLCCSPLDALRPIARLLRKVGIAVFLVLLVMAGALALPANWLLPKPYDTLPTLPQRGAFIAAWLVAITMASWCLMSRRNIIPFITACAWGMQLWLFYLALPAADEYRTREAFIAEARDILGHQMAGLALCDARDVIYDLDLQPGVPEYSAVEEAETALRTGRARWIIVPHRRWPNVRLPVKVVVAEARQSWEGGEEVGDKMMLLTRAGDSDQ